MTVDLSVENPTGESPAVRSYRLAGYVGGELVLGERRCVLKQPAVGTLAGTAASTGDQRGFVELPPALLVGLVCAAGALARVSVPPM